MVPRRSKVQRGTVLLRPHGISLPGTESDQVIWVVKVEWSAHKGTRYTQARPSFPWKGSG